MTIPPQAIPPGTTVGGQGGAASGGPGATPAQVSAAQQVANAIAKLPVESLLQAAVQSRSGNELTLLTALGQVNIKLPTPLPANLGDLLWVRIMPQGHPQQGSDPAATLRLQVLPQTLTPGPTGTGSSLPTASINSNPLIPGQTFSAITTSNLTLPNGSQLPAGSQTQIVFVGQGAVSAGKAAQIANMTAPGTPTGIPTATTPVITSSGTLPTPSAAGLAGQAVAGGSGGTTPTPLVLTGTVLPPDSAEARMLPNGFTALRTSAGVVGIKLPMPAPVGATLSFSVDANTAAGRGTQIPQMMTEAELISRGQNAALSRDWGSLQQAVTALVQHDPAAAAALLNNIPQAGPKLTTTMMFFFAAMTGPGGTARGWMGDRASNSLSSIDGNGDDILKKLEGDFSRLRGMVADERPDGWRVMPMPFQMGDRIEQVRLAWRHGDEENEKGEKEEPGTRFLLDLSFSEVGHTQLDGLVKGEGNKFDLIVRTENPLQSVNRDDIRGIFREALQISGYNGHLIFQDGSRFVEIAPPANEPGHGSHHGIEA
ncbi:hypothetical protein [Thalassospira australica]|uniref:hypothetical protein n=1 Tax=Thalassospira australica TaxID=1528106 RepID=UPI00384CEF57